MIRYLMGLLSGSTTEQVGHSSLEHVHWDFAGRRWVGHGEAETQEASAA